MKTLISADSTCDLPESLIAEYGIRITPLYIVKDGVSYRDGLEISPADIYAHIDAGGAPTTTAAVTVADYEEFFRAALEEYDEVVHFCISSDMSSCWQNACIVAGELGNIYPVDSRNLSTGIGHLVLDAAEAARSGVSGAEIARMMEEKREKLDVSFVLDTLAYLRRGGRCSSVAALGANLLSIKPCIEVHDGKMGVAKKYRGKIENCYLQYIRDRLQGRDDIDLHRIFITDSGLSEELRDRLQAEILSCQPFERVERSAAGCTVSAHCGPGCMGILYYHK